MRLQVLLSTMHQSDHSVLEKVNIGSDAIVVNQCDVNRIENLDYNGHEIKFISLAERGVGLSRSTALTRAEADIVLFADDDVVYNDDYAAGVLKAFEQHPSADVILFNVPCTNPERQSYIIPKFQRVQLYNCLRYGTFRIAARLRSLRYANINGFSLLFGGGAKYGSGEDSIFLYECIKKGLKVYADPTVIGSVTHADSTWFKGYTDRCFFDKGALYACLSKRWAYVLCLQYAVRRRKKFNKEKSVALACKAMFEGVREVRAYLP